MSLNNGIITKPIKMTDIYNCIGVGPKQAGYDLGYASSNKHGKTNIYSFCKPIPRAGTDETKFTRNTYKDNLKLKSYTFGDPIPTTTLADYTPPQGGVNQPFRMSDWNNYDHNQYAFKIDVIGIPDLITDGWFRQYGFDYDESLIHPLIPCTHTYYSVGFLYIFTALNKPNVYITSNVVDSYSKKIDVGLNFNDLNLYTFFNQHGLDTYDCTIIPFLGSMYDEYGTHMYTTEVKTLPLAPKWQQSTTIVSKKKFEKPKTRSFCRLMFYNNKSNDYELDIVESNFNTRYCVTDEQGNILAISDKTGAGITLVVANQYEIDMPQLILKEYVGKKLIVEVDVPTIMVDGPGGPIEACPVSTTCGGNVISKDSYDGKSVTYKSEYTIVDGYNEFHCGGVYNDPYYRPDEY